MIFYSTLSGLPTNFISFCTSAGRCPTIFLYRLSRKIEGPLLTVLRPYYAQKTERTSSYLPLHSFFFGMLFTRMSQTGVCQYYVYLSIRELQNCSDMQLPSPGELFFFF